MELEVKGCSECPMCDMNDMCVGYTCRLETERTIDEDKNHLPITPSWCPLKIEPIIITLKEN